MNVKGTLFTVQKAPPLLNDGASVVLNASTAAEHGAQMRNQASWAGSALG